ncbi:unnamed protein product, partial [Mesorhabditis spiculigera]
MAEVIANWLTSTFRHSKKPKSEQPRKERDRRTGRRNSLPYEYGCEDKIRRDTEDSGHDEESLDGSCEDIERAESLRRRAWVDRILKRTSTRLSSKSRRTDADSLEDESYRRGSDDLKYDDILELQRKWFNLTHRPTEGFGLLNRRALSDSELVISTDECSEKDCILEKYGLIDTEETDPEMPIIKRCLCVPDGVEIGDFECRLGPEFFQGLARSIDSGSGEVELGSKKMSQPVMPDRIRNTTLPVQIRDSGQPLLPKRVVTLAIGGLKKSLGIGKGKKDSSHEDADEEDDDTLVSTTKIDWAARTKIATNDAAMPLVDFYLSMSLRARKAATQIIKENADLRHINNTLRQDLAFPPISPALKVLAVETKNKKKK